MSARPVIWTDIERHLLKLPASQIGHCIASPTHGINYMRAGSNSAWSTDYHYQFSSTGLYGEWTDRTGQHTATITYARLQRWCVGLPVKVREQAGYWFHPDTRDIRRLEALVRSVVDADAAPAAAKSAALTLF